jgi:murein DD-endopeptidase MepM/ murein hydrolase activator NlpD
VVLTHADGYETWYLHLGSFADEIEVGDPVAAGDVIGYVGSTGNAAGTSPHTHFEIHRNGRPIDPYPFLRASFERWVLSQQIEAGETPFR